MTALYTPPTAYIPGTSRYNDGEPVDGKNDEWITRKQLDGKNPISFARAHKVPDLGESGPSWIGAPMIGIGALSFVGGALAMTGDAGTAFAGGLAAVVAGVALAAVGLGLQSSFSESKKGVRDVLVDVTQQRKFFEYGNARDNHWLIDSMNELRDVTSAKVTEACIVDHDRNGDHKITYDATRGKSESASRDPNDGGDAQRLLHNADANFGNNNGIVNAQELGSFFDSNNDLAIEKVDDYDPRGDNAFLVNKLSNYDLQLVDKEYITY